MLTNQRKDGASAVVLAGGLSRRLGHDKRSLKLWGAAGPTLLEHTVDLAARLCDEVIVVLNDRESWGHLQARLVSDMYPDGGSLGGIYSGLTAATHDYALVVASDMPFLSADLIEAMLLRPRTYDVLIPRSLEAGSTRNQLDVEPLHAIYGKACLEPMRAMLESGRRQIAAFFPNVHMAYIEPEETQRYDPSGRSLLSINTPEQLADAIRRLEPAPSD